MQRRFLLHSLSHTFVLVDISAIGLPTEIYPAAGQPQQVMAVRYQTWNDVEAYFSKLGADAGVVERTAEQLKRNSVAVLTIA